MARRHIVSGLDIGTTKVVSVIAEIGPNGYPVIKGVGESPTIGLRKGTVFDVAALGKSIENAVRLSQEMTGEHIKSVFVSVPLTKHLTREPDRMEDQLIESIMLTGLEIEDLIPSVVASAEGILTNTDKTIGTVLMDVGGTTTGLAVFDQGFSVFSHYLAVGSDHITSDLALCLRTSINEAERIKRSLGLVAPEQEINLNISSVGGHEIRKVPASAAQDIIQSRTQEIIELALRELQSHFRLESLAGGLILTGGGSLLKGIVDLCCAHMNVNKVSIGTPGKELVPREEWISPEYTSAIGLVICGSQKGSRRSGRHTGWREILNKFR